MTQPGARRHLPGAGRAESCDCRRRPGRSLPAGLHRLKGSPKGWVLCELRLQVRGDDGFEEPRNAAPLSRGQELKGQRLLLGKSHIDLWSALAVTACHNPSLSYLGPRI